MTVREFIKEIKECNATFTVYEGSTEKNVLEQHSIKKDVLEKYATRELMAYGQKCPDKTYYLYIR